MPRLSQIQHGALESIVTDLRYASREALVRDIERAEDLAAEIDVSVRYPADWVVFRITGYRPDLDDPALIEGGALLADLSAIVERLCAGARLTPEEAGAEALSLDGLAERWGVSVKTLGRWRRRGLIARRVHADAGVVRVVVTPGAIAAWESREPGLIERAGVFSRIDEATALVMVRRARRYHDLLDLHPTQVAQRLGERFGRSTEAVRQLLLRHDASARRTGEGEPVFAPPEALPGRTRRAIERAWRRGVEPSAITARYGRSKGGVHRIVGEQRLARLRGLDLGRIASEASVVSEGAVDGVLAAHPLEVLPALAPVRDLTEFLAMCRAHEAPVAVEERAWSRAEHVLRARAAGVLARPHTPHPESGLIDRAETDLRWAAQLRAALARTQLSLVVRTLEGKAGRPLDEFRASDALALVRSGLSALGPAIDAFDPWGSGRLASPVGLGVSRVSVSRGVADASRAKVRLMPGTPGPDWVVAASPWLPDLRGGRWIERALPGLDEESARVVRMRFGLAGEQPRTLAEMARVCGVTVMQAGRMERSAMRKALAVVGGRVGGGGAPGP